MKFSLSWLKACLDTDASVETIAAKLNAIGLEVESVDDPAAKLTGFRIARVISATRHPDADKLQVLSIDVGDGTPLQVVCGAPNARAGLVGVLGQPGAVVPANGMVLKKAAVRGVESQGMMCSTRELELGDDHEGIIELPGDAPVGAAFADYHGADPVFDVSITPNRPDCMGVYGIARDLAAAGIGTLKPIVVEPVAGGFACPIAIRTEDSEGCPAFYGRVIRGVSNGQSPEWLRTRLKSAGQRPISALVDITNYVMLTYGRPTHAYDLAKLSGPVVARRACDGETVTALNGKSYALDGSMTVIADATGVHDIAGIMGGEHSGCSAETRDVLLEVAYFDPQRIAATGRKLNLTSDARSRFERGVDCGFLDTGLDLLTALIVEICGGEPSEVIRAGRIYEGPASVAYDPALAERLGGVAVAEDEQRRILNALGFGVLDANVRRQLGELGRSLTVTGSMNLQTVQPVLRPEPLGAQDSENGNYWIVSPPGWRPDIDAAPDIVEEVVRIHGLDRIVSVPLARQDGVALPTATPAQRLERRLRRAAAARGLNEAITWSFLPMADAEAFADSADLWVLANPISEDMKAMRPSLLPGLLAATRRNLDRGAAGLRLFEIGRRYLRGAEGRSDERATLAVLLAGEKSARGQGDGFRCL
jgi:phenylalanyl-tRNA synthetase beta chain